MRKGGFRFVSWLEFFGGVLILAALNLGGAGGCGGEETGTTNDDGDTGGAVCTSTEKTDALDLIQSLDQDPQPAQATNAIRAGCAASTTNLETFMAAFLDELGLDSACATDTDTQNAFDNWEGPDTSDMPGTCANT